MNLYIKLNIMAISNRNIITHGLSGLIGDLIVFRQRAGKTVVAVRPHSSARPATPPMVLARARFVLAVSYAKAAIKDQHKKSAYLAIAKPGQTAFNVAIADFQCPPEIEENPDLKGYNGLPGDIITVSVIDDFMVNTVWIQIISADGTLLEEGLAVQDENKLDWNYTITAVNNSIKGSGVIFKAKDLPGNETTVIVNI